MDISNEENTVEVDLWYSTSLDLGELINDELSAMSVSFQNNHQGKALFTPRIATYPCKNCDPIFTRENCVSDGQFCAYTPSFYQYYGLDEDPNFRMSGKDVLVQGLREKCLHKLMSTKYQDEGAVFFTFLNYIDECFGKDTKSKATSLADCYDWSTVMIGNTDEVTYINECVDMSFERMGDYSSKNTILAADRHWAKQNHVTLHPSITVNNMTYSNATG